MTRIEAMARHLLSEIPRLHRAGALNRDNFTKQLTDSLTTRYPDVTVLELEAAAKRLDEFVTLLEKHRPANSNRRGR